MRLHSHSLRSKVAQRIFAVFLVCAIIPFTGLLLTSYYQVSTFFNHRNEQQLRALAKFMGMDLFETLALLESGLKIVRSALLTVEGIPSTAIIETLLPNPSDRWKSMALLSSSGRSYHLVGQLERVPEFSSSDRQALATGKPLVKAVSAGPDGRSRIFMSLIIDPKQAEPDILVGEIENAYLWELGNSRLLPPYVHGCILDQTAITLICDSMASASCRLA